VGQGLAQRALSALHTGQGSQARDHPAQAEQGRKEVIYMTPEFADAIRRKRRIRRALRVEAIIGYLAALGLLVLLARVGYDALMPLWGSHVYLEGYGTARLERPCEVNEYLVLHLEIRRERNELIAKCVNWQRVR
jgi:hypothetical protein